MTVISVPTATQEFTERQDTALRLSFFVVGPAKIVHPARADMHKDIVAQSKTAEDLTVEHMDFSR
jgi:hypothetical protein